MTRKLWFQWGVGILLLIFIIKFMVEINWIFSPILIILETIFVPLLISGVLFYLTVPLQTLLEKFKFPRWSSIIIIFLLLIALLWAAIAIVGPPITKQVNNLIEKTPTFIDEGIDITADLIEKSENWPQWAKDSIDTVQDRIAESQDKITESINDITKKIGSWIKSIFTSAVQVSLTMILIPFFLFFMLKDHDKMMPFILQFFRGEMKNWIKKTFADVNDVLSLYIRGQVLISTILATILFIGYLIIGLKFALLLAVFAFFMNIIPFIGPWIAFIPALVIGFFQDPMLVIWVSLTTLIAQQTDSNLITPNIMGRQLNVHPLTIITILLAAGSLAGFFGILLAVPGYAVGKAIISNIYEKRATIKETLQKRI